MTTRLLLLALPLAACSQSLAYSGDLADSAVPGIDLLEDAEGRWACNQDLSTGLCLRWPEGDIPLAMAKPSLPREDRAGMSRAELVDLVDGQAAQWNEALSDEGITHSGLTGTGWVDTDCDALIPADGGLPEEAIGQVLVCLASQEAWDAAYPGQPDTLARTRVSLDTAVGVVGALIILGPSTFQGTEATAEAVSLHELGHALGLMHNAYVEDNRADAMFEEISAAQDGPTDHDRAGLAEGLYGEGW